MSSSFNFDNPWIFYFIVKLCAFYLFDALCLSKLHLLWPRWLRRAYPLFQSLSCLYQWHPQGARASASRCCNSSPALAFPLLLMPGKSPPSLEQLPRRLLLLKPTLRGSLGRRQLRHPRRSLLGSPRQVLNQISQQNLIFFLFFKNRSLLMFMIILLS